MAEWFEVLLPNGEPVKFDLDSFVTLDTISPFSQAVAPVLVVNKTEIHCIGTAFSIAANGLWVTARHVVDSAIELVGDDPDARMVVLWLDPNEGAPTSQTPTMFVVVTRHSKDDPNGSDLALLKADTALDDKPRPYPRFQLSARVPKIGTRVLAMGYHRFTVSKDTTTIEAGPPREIVFKRNLSVSTGQVLQVFRRGRDTFRDLDGRFSGKLPTVCFETSARFEAGMSGGPVIDENGSVCGIVATGVESPGSASDNSFASATPFLFNLAMTHDNEDGPLTVHQMVQQGTVLCDSFFDQLIITEQDGQQAVLTYPCED